MSRAEGVRSVLGRIGGLSERGCVAPCSGCDAIDRYVGLLQCWCMYVERTVLGAGCVLITECVLKNECVGGKGTREAFGRNWDRPDEKVRVMAVGF